MKFFLHLFWIGWIGCIHAKEIYPAHCKPRVISKLEWILPANTSTIIMLHNLSKTDVWITHDSTSTSPNWSSRLEKGHWSALVNPSHPLTLKCVESKPGHEQEVACAEVLAMCQWDAKTLPTKQSNTPWAAEDMPLSPLVAYLERQGLE